MKPIVSYLAIAIAAFTAGYLAHPLLNSNNTAQVTTSVQDENKKVVDSTSAEPQPIESAKPKSASFTATATAKTKKQPEQNKDDGPLEIIEDIPHNSSVNSATSEQKAELEQWAKQHKAELNDLIVAHIPDSVGPSLFKQININNEFLSEPKMKQEPELDSNWAYNAEQELKTYIENHEQAANFELINVTCKQLKCEILGIEKEAQAWLKIFFSMFKNLPNVNPPDSSGDTTSISYLNGDNTTSIYYQLKFKPS